MQNIHFVEHCLGKSVTIITIYWSKHPILIVTVKHNYDVTFSSTDLNVRNTFVDNLSL